jgi:hypothetical protein
MGTRISPLFAIAFFGASPDGYSLSAILRVCAKTADTIPPDDELPQLTRNRGLFAEIRPASLTPNRAACLSGWFQVIVWRWPPRTLRDHRSLPSSPGFSSFAGRLEIKVARFTRALRASLWRQI